MIEAKRKATDEEIKRNKNNHQPSERRDIRSEDPPRGYDIYDREGNRIGRIGPEDHMPGPSGLW